MGSSWVHTGVEPLCQQVDACAFQKGADISMLEMYVVYSTWLMNVILCFDSVIKNITTM